jgi:type I restriction enzyme, S subunit
MELKPGYKQTEVGVIPEEWKLGTLDQFWCVTDCKHVTASFTFSGYPVASIREVQAKYVNLGNCKYTDKHFFDLLTEGGRQPKDGDLIMSRNATVGEVAQVTKDHPQFAMGQDVCLLQRRDKELSPTYLQALLQSPIIAEQLSSMQVGSTFKRANIEQIRSFKVAMPPSPEQKAIAEQLDCVDDHIYAISALIVKKRAIKQAAMQELLTGKRRLPGFEGEWEEVMLGEHATFFKGKGLPKSMLTAFGTYACVHYGELFTLYTESIHDTASYTSNADGLFFSQENDVLMPTSDVTPRGLAKASCTCRDGIAIGGDILVIRADSRKINGIFLSYLIRHDSAQILRLVTGTTVYHIYSGDMKKFTFRLPSVSEQGAIVQFLDDLGAELRFLETRLEKTQAIKQGMMQELLTGRIRLR